MRHLALMILSETFSKFRTAFFESAGNPDKTKPSPTLMVNTNKNKKLNLTFRRKTIVIFREVIFKSLFESYKHNFNLINLYIFELISIRYL